MSQETENKVHYIFMSYENLTEEEKVGKTEREVAALEIHRQSEGFIALGDLIRQNMKSYGIESKECIGDGKKKTVVYFGIVPTDQCPSATVTFRATTTK